jgi:hypothetical protein
MIGPCRAMDLRSGMRPTLRPAKLDDGGRSECISRPRPAAAPMARLTPRIMRGTRASFEARPYGARHRLSRASLQADSSSWLGGGCRRPITGSRGVLSAPPNKPCAIARTRSSRSRSWPPRARAPGSGPGSGAAFLRGVPQRPLDPWKGRRPASPSEQPVHDAQPVRDHFHDVQREKRRLAHQKEKALLVQGNQRAVADRRNGRASRRVVD